MESPLVSILIPNYNKSPYLRETLDSVLSQSYTHWECIVVDDHSTDDSWEILEEYAARDLRFKIYKRPLDRKQGGNAARNFAFEMSKGEYINWVDSDDIIVPSKLEKQLNHMLLTNSDIVLGKIENSDDRLPKKEFIYETNKNRRPISFLKGDFWFATSIPLIKKEFLGLLETLFDEDLKRNQEIEFFSRILLKKPEIGFIDSVQMIRVFDSNSIFSTYQNLSSKDKINLDYPTFLRLAKNFKNEGFWDPEEKEYFVNWYIRIIQYSEFKIIEFGRLFFLSFLYGTNHQRLVLIKSIIYKILPK